MSIATIVIMDTKKENSPIELAAFISDMPTDTPQISPDLTPAQYVAIKLPESVRSIIGDYLRMKAQQPAKNEVPN